MSNVAVIPRHFVMGVTDFSLTDIEAPRGIAFELGGSGRPPRGPCFRDGERLRERTKNKCVTALTIRVDLPDGQARRRGRMSRVRLEWLGWPLSGAAALQQGDGGGVCFT